MTDSERGFLNNAYKVKVADLCAQYDVTRADVEQLYLDQCREIDRRMKQGTPRRIIRRLAFTKTESALAETAGAPDE